jgi:hypothetical protein
MSFWQKHVAVIYQANDLVCLGCETAGERMISLWRVEEPEAMLFAKY